MVGQGKTIADGLQAAWHDPQRLAPLHHHFLVIAAVLWAHAPRT